MSKELNKPRGILKNKNALPSTTEQRAPDPREVAVKHARIIHSRREIEDQISDSIIELSKFPVIRDFPYNASNPPPADAEAFRNQVRLYQPSDYDDLIEERNANGLCGYTLCPNPRSRVSGGGTFKILNYGRKDFNIVPSRELEKWCSQTCAKRAMYVKVQLNETAAWERAGIASIRIELYEEDLSSAADDATKQLERDIENMKIEALEKSAQNAQDLALERGDNIENGKTSKRSMKLTIKEKPVKAPAAPSLGGDSQAHLVTEGYKTTFDPKSETVSQEDKITGAKETVLEP
ncbi:Rtr1/RPAP2 family-domain-containing protein [Ustulina deusta]|nr:Rtr1/RPAP2 family-domain-containing protein [Ustulina deusta]KAI3337685.1 Rtr1/RPAP2 family-domain-containing protein [Ustulina deusta]